MLTSERHGVAPPVQVGSDGRVAGIPAVVASPPMLVSVRLTWLAGASLLVKLSGAAGLLVPPAPVRSGIGVLFWIFTSGAPPRDAFGTVARNTFGAGYVPAKPDPGDSLTVRLTIPASPQDAVP